VRDHPPVLFELHDVSLTRGDSLVLDSVSADIHDGATAIVGPSGSGKSTLLRLLNRLAEPDGGAISYRGRSLVEYDPLELRREVSLVPQLPALLEGTIESNLRYAADLAGRELDMVRCLGHAGLDPGFAERDVSKLSVGEQQRAMLARALAQQPRVLLLDEPTQGVDVGAKAAIYELIHDAAARVAAVVLASSDTSELAAVCDRVLVMRDGRAAAEVASADLTEERLVIESLGLASASLAGSGIDG
jgi:putative ABC transport system ATP-binding protein